MKEIVFFGYIAFISTISVVLCIYDKIASEHMQGARIREKTLCLCAVVGGALAMLLTMCWIRHKTRHTWIIALCTTAAVIWTVIYSVVFLAFIL